MLPPHDDEGVKITPALLTSQITDILYVDMQFDQLSYNLEACLVRLTTDYGALVSASPTDLQLALYAQAAEDARIKCYVDYMNSDLNVHQLRGVLIFHTVSDDEPVGYGDLALLKSPGAGWNLNYARRVVNAICKPEPPSDSTYSLDLPREFQTFLRTLTGEEADATWGTEETAYAAITDFNSLLVPSIISYDIFCLLFSTMFDRYDRHILGQFQLDGAPLASPTSANIQPTNTAPGRIVWTDSYTNPTELTIAYVYNPDKVVDTAQIKLNFDLTGWRVLHQRTVPIKCMYRIYMYGFEELATAGKYNAALEGPLDEEIAQCMKIEAHAWAAEQEWNPCAAYRLIRTLVKHTQKLHQAHRDLTDLLIGKLQILWDFGNVQLVPDIILALDRLIGDCKIGHPLNVRALRLLGRIRLSQKLLLAQSFDAQAAWPSCDALG